MYFMFLFDICLILAFCFLEMTAVHTGNINFKWDPKSLEIRTLAVERLLEPLVTQVRIWKHKCIAV